MSDLTDMVGEFNVTGAGTSGVSRQAPDAGTSNLEVLTKGAAGLLQSGVKVGEMYIDEQIREDTLAGRNLIQNSAVDPAVFERDFAGIAKAAKAQGVDLNRRPKVRLELAAAAIQNRLIGKYGAHWGPEIKQAMQYSLSGGASGGVGAASVLAAEQQRQMEEFESRATEAYPNMPVDVAIENLEQDDALLRSKPITSASSFDAAAYSSYNDVLGSTEKSSLQSSNNPEALRQNKQTILSKLSHLEGLYGKLNPNLRQGRHKEVYEYWHGRMENSLKMIEAVEKGNKDLAEQLETQIKTEDAYFTQGIPPKMRYINQHPEIAEAIIAKGGWTELNDYYTESLDAAEAKFKMSQNFTELNSVVGSGNQDGTFTNPEQSSLRYSKSKAKGYPDTTEGNAVLATDVNTILKNPVSESSADALMAVISDNTLPDRLDKLEGPAAERTRKSLHSKAALLGDFYRGNVEAELNSRGFQFNPQTGTIGGYDQMTYDQARRVALQPGESRDKDAAKAYLAVHEEMNKYSAIARTDWYQTQPSVIKGDSAGMDANQATPTADPQRVVTPAERVREGYNPDTGTYTRDTSVVGESAMDPPKDMDEMKDRYKKAMESPEFDLSKFIVDGVKYLNELIQYDPSGVREVNKDGTEKKKEGVSSMPYFNNPGNIEVGQGFDGETGETYNDGRFAVFDTPEHGVRAMARDLSTKIDRGLDTVAKILYVYAPPEENDTEAYIKTVTKIAGVDKDEVITKDKLEGVVKAMIVQENGRDALKYYTDDIIKTGVRMNQDPLEGKTVLTSGFSGEALSNIVKSLFSSDKEGMPRAPRRLPKANGDGDVLVRAPRRASEAKEQATNILSTIIPETDHAEAAINSLGIYLLEKAGLPVPEYMKTITENDIGEDVLNSIKKVVYKAYKETGGAIENYGRWSEDAKNLVQNRSSLTTGEQLGAVARSFFDADTAAGFIVGSLGKNSVRIENGDLIIEEPYDHPNLSSVKDNGPWMKLIKFMGEAQPSKKNTPILRLNLGKVD